MSEHSLAHEQSASWWSNSLARSLVFAAALIGQSCGHESTGLDLFVSYDPALGLDQLLLSGWDPDDNIVFAGQRRPQTPRPLTEGRNDVVLIVPARLGGKLLRVQVEGLRNDVAVASQQAEFEIHRNHVVQAELTLEAFPLCGPGAVDPTQQVCADDDVCTADRCDPLVGCVFDPIAACCTSSQECDDHDPCTNDECQGAAGCVHAELGCVTSASSYSITAGHDDAEETALDGTMWAESRDLELTYESDHALDQLVGLRFDAVDLPADAQIITATIQFAALGADDSETSLLIFGETTAQPAPFSATPGDISRRPRTTSSVAWSKIAPWVPGDSGPAEQTPNLLPIVSEIIAGGGWQRGDAMVFIFVRDPTAREFGTRVACSLESPAGDRCAPDTAPILHIAFRSL